MAHNAMPYVQDWFAKMPELADGGVEVMRMAILNVWLLLVALSRQRPADDRFAPAADMPSRSAFDPNSDIEPDRILWADVKPYSACDISAHAQAGIFLDVTAS
jgi:hypothetical protein